MMETAVMTGAAAGTCGRLRRQSSLLCGGRVFVEIPAAGQQAVVYVNGTEVCAHEGGYSIFAQISQRHVKKKGKICWQWRAAMREQDERLSAVGGFYVLWRALPRRQSHQCA